MSDTAVPTTVVKKTVTDTGQAKRSRTVDREEGTPPRKLVSTCHRFFDVIVDRMGSTQGTRQGTGSRMILGLDKIAKSIGLTGVHIRCVHSKSGKGFLSKLVRNHGWTPNGCLVPSKQLSEHVYFYRGPNEDRIPIAVKDSRQLRELHEYEATNTPEQEREASEDQNADVVRCASLEEVKEWMQEVQHGRQRCTSRTFLIADDFKVTLLLSRAPRLRSVDFRGSRLEKDTLTDAVSPPL